MAILKMQPSTRPVSSVDVSIGRQVHELLWTRGVRQQPVYEALGIGRSTLTKKLRGEIRWYAEDLVVVAGLLGVAPGDLLPRVDSNHQSSGYWFAVSPPQAWRSHVTCIQPTRWG